MHEGFPVGGRTGTESCQARLGVGDLVLRDDNTGGVRERTGRVVGRGLKKAGASLLRFF